MQDYSLTKDIIADPNLADNSIQIALVVMISINIGIEVFRFITMLVITKKDKHNKRDLLIEEKRIKILEKLFQSLDKLSLYDRDESEDMLISIKKINLFITKNKLYIPKKYQNCSNEVLDYFKNVLTDYRQKNIETETKLFEKFCNEFNK
jgi:hypothetical protein